MNALDITARLARLGVLLQLRDAAIAPVVTAAAAARGELLVGASAHGRRLELIMAYEPTAAAALGLAPPPTAPPGDARLHLRIDGDDVVAGLARPGPIAPAEAVAAIGEGLVRDRWLELVEQLCAIADARPLGVTRFGDRRAQLDIGYPRRTRTVELELMMGIDQLAEDLGISAAQRTLWRGLHPRLGDAGGELTIATSCLPTAVSPTLAFRYPITRWETAMRLAEGLVLDGQEARQIPVALGHLAGALGSDELRGLELVLGPHEPPEVLVWANIAPR